MRRPSDDQVVLTILENLIPTAFATFLEPFWVVLNRLLCLLQPFEELRTGDARYSRSLGVKYTSLPPQLIIWRAFRSKHFLLGAVCSVSIGINVLAVSLSGLFEEKQVLTSYSGISSLSILPSFNTSSSIVDFANPQVGNTYLDHFYVSKANMTAGVPLPAWVDKHRFYLPFDVQGSPSTPLEATDSIQSVTGRTTAFEVSISCVPLQYDPGEQNGLTFQAVKNNQIQQFDMGNTVAQFKTTVSTPNGSTIDCISTFGLTFSNSSAIAVPSETHFAVEPRISGLMFEEGACQDQMLAVWARPVLSPLPWNNRTEGLNISSMACLPTLTTTLYDVTVDLSGYVQTSTIVKNTSSSFDSVASNISFISQLNDLVWGLGNTVWHNETQTADYFNDLLAIYTGSHEHVDPHLPPPNATALIPAVEDIYSGLAAIVLGLNTHIFALPNSSSAAGAFDIEFSVQETRIFMSPVMFYIAVTNLFIILIVAAWYYVQRPKKFLPRMPTSIASLLAYVSASHAFAQTGPHVEKKIAGREAMVQTDIERKKFAYGWFIGTDGKGHVGIEFADNVVPLYDSQMGFRKRRRWCT